MTFESQFFSHPGRKGFIKIFIIVKTWTRSAVVRWIDITLHYGVQSQYSVALKHYLYSGRLWFFKRDRMITF